MTETVLWTNPSPTSDFTSQTVTLSDDINNYAFIKIQFRRSIGDSTTANVIYAIEDLKKYVGNGSLFGAMSLWSGTTSSFARRIGYVSDTKISISSLTQIGGNSAAGQSSGAPTQIIGMK